MTRLINPAKPKANAGFQAKSMKEVDFAQLMDLLYSQRCRLNGYKVQFSPEQGEQVDFQVFGNDGELVDLTTTDPDAVGHLLRFRRAHDPSNGAEFVKIKDFEAHQEAWDKATKISQQDRDKARQALLNGKASIDFDWSRLLHDSMGGIAETYGQQFLPLVENHTLLLAHLEIMGLKSSQRLEKMEKAEGYGDAVQLVRDMMGFVESPTGFLPRMLAMPGGPNAVGNHVTHHSRLVGGILDALASNDNPDRRLNLYIALSMYATLLETLRPPLIILAKSLEQTHPTGRGNTNGRLADLAEFLNTHPKVGTRTKVFLDPDLRVSFAHGRFRITDTGLELTNQHDSAKIDRTLTADELFVRLKGLGIFFPEAALMGALSCYFLDARLMMVTVPYVEWLVAVGNAQR